LRLPLKEGIGGKREGDFIVDLIERGKRKTPCAANERSKVICTPFKWSFLKWYMFWEYVYI
jgi:hypothetical protein